MKTCRGKILCCLFQCGGHAEIEYCVACFSVEAQRDEAVQNLLEAQTSLEDFQRRSHERMKAVSIDRVCVHMGHSVCVCVCVCVCACMHACLCDCVVQP